MTIEELRHRLDHRRSEGVVPSAARVAADLDVVHASNAIEGNRLTRAETEAVVVQGQEIAGRSIRDHQEAIDLHEALAWTREVAAGDAPIDEILVRHLHGMALRRSRPDIAGAYARHPRRIAGAGVAFPSQFRVPDLMHSFGRRLKDAVTPADAFDAHYRLAAIHPFDDGNGRTARLLMNAILLRHGWPAVNVRIDDHSTYLDAIRAAQTADDVRDPAYVGFMEDRLRAALIHEIAITTGPRPQGHTA